MIITATNVDAVISLKDKFTQPMRLMESQAQKLSKSLNDNSTAVSQLNKRQKELVSQQTKLEMSVEKQRKTVGDARKEWKKLGDEQSEIKLSKAKEEYNALTKNLKDFKSAAKEATTDVERLSSAQSKMSNRSGGLASKLGEAGFIKLGGDVATQMADTFVNSAFGSEAGSMFSATLSGAVNGAAMGALMGAPAIGAALGAGAGALSGITERFEAKDDFYRASVEELYTNSQNKWALELQSGTEYTIGKQKNIAAMSTLLGGREKGERMYEDIRDYGINTPYQGANVLNSAKQMLAYGIDEENIMGDIRNLGDIAMGDQGRLDSLAYAYSQVQSEGKLRGQDLLQFTSAGFNPLKVLAEEQGRTLVEMRDLMSRGLISSQDVTRAIETATGEGGQFYGSAKEQMNTYAGQKAMFKDRWDFINSGYGEGYTDTKMKSFNYEDNLLDVWGDDMKKMNEIIGHNEASEENEKESLARQAIRNILSSPEFQSALSNNDAEALYEFRSQIEAQKDSMWKTSDTYKEQQDRATETVEIMQTALRDEPGWIDTGRQIGIQLSHGIRGGFDYAGPTALDSSNPVKFFGSPNPYVGPSKAINSFGSPNPYNTPHISDGGGPLAPNKVPVAESKPSAPVSVAGNNFYIREEADVYKVASAIFDKVNTAKELS